MLTLPRDHAKWNPFSKRPAVEPYPGRADCHQTDRHRDQAPHQGLSGLPAIPSLKLAPGPTNVPMSRLRPGNSYDTAPTRTQQAWPHMWPRDATHKPARNPSMSHGCCPRPPPGPSSASMNRAARHLDVDDGYEAPTRGVSVHSPTGDPAEVRSALIANGRPQLPQRWTAPGRFAVFPSSSSPVPETVEVQRAFAEFPLSSPED
jgi:hypothetical protein